MKSVAVITCIAVLALSAAGTAGPNYYHKLALHVVPHGVTCKNMPSFASCRDITATYTGTGDIDVLPVFFDLNGCLLIEFGLMWPEAWGTCAYSTCVPGISVGRIVNPGDAIATAWSDCRNDWAIPHGSAWLNATGPGLVSFVPSPKTEWIGVVDCRGQEEPAYDWPAAIFSAGIGGRLGDDPCEPVLLPLSLSVSNGIDSGCVHPGNTLIYTLSYDNTANASEVHDSYLVLDRDFRKTEFISASPGGYHNPNNGSVLWNISGLASGKKDFQEVVLRVNDSAAGDTLMIHCKIAADRTPLGTARLATRVCAGDFSLLDLTNDDGLAGTCANQEKSITYTITYGNSRNTSEIHDVTLSDHLSTMARFLSASSGAVYDSASHTATWYVGSLLPGQSGSQSLVVEPRAGPGEIIRNTCEIRALEPVANSVSKSTQVCGSRPRNAGCKLAVHVKPHGTSCRDIPVFTSCDKISTTYPGCGDLDFIPVFFDLNEYAQAELGLTWPQEWGTCVFTTCTGNISMGSLTHPGDGFAVGWTSCQQTWSVALGHGWLDAGTPGKICPGIGPGSSRLRVRNCEDPPVYDSPQAVYCAGVCGVMGDNPCSKTDTLPTPGGTPK